MKFFNCFAVLFVVWIHSICFADSGINLTADEGAGARYSGMANTFLGLPGDITALSVNPAAMNDVEDLSFSLAHFRKFNLANYNHFAVLFPINQLSSLGLGISRFGVNNLQYFRSTDPDEETGETFDIAEYLITAALSRRWGGLDVGGSFHMLYREIEQSGFGIRADLSIQYQLLKTIYFGALLKGAVPSSTYWTSEYFEYEPPNLFLGLGFNLPSEYLYGVIRGAVQTKGIIVNESNSLYTKKGEAFYDSPQDIYRAANIGLEYSLNLGLKLRFGLSELGNSWDEFGPSFGIGYEYKKFISLDYSFQAHPELESTHRISLVFVPFFFNGQFKRNRNESFSSPPVVHKNITKLPKKEEEEEKGEQAVPELEKEAEIPAKEIDSEILEAPEEEEELEELEEIEVIEELD
ncbi:MAG: hypothetical protein HQK83_00560 [Fibrobacteria bacterium]|nr:hypothetical protein [Fibrobacteria bacterium]